MDVGRGHFLKRWNLSCILKIDVIWIGLENREGQRLGVGSEHEGKAWQWGGPVWAPETVKEQREGSFRAVLGKMEREAGGHIMGSLSTGLSLGFYSGGQPLSPMLKTWILRDSGSVGLGWGSGTCSFNKHCTTGDSELVNGGRALKSTAWRVGAAVYLGLTC